jgi:hypothetical protein
MLRAYVRNMMFLATLPYYLAGDMTRNSAPEGPSAATGERRREP